MFISNFILFVLVSLLTHRIRLLIFVFSIIIDGHVYSFIVLSYYQCVQMILSFFYSEYGKNVSLNWINCIISVFDW